MEKAQEVYQSCKKSMETGVVDVAYWDFAPGERFLAPYVRVSVDKFGQVYLTEEF